ncbi:MAG: DUF1707 domain-containing protein [Thermoleophilia bacterium]
MVVTRGAGRRIDYQQRRGALRSLRPGAAVPSGHGAAPARRTTPDSCAWSDAERDRAAALLRDAHAEGRLEFGEFEGTGWRRRSAPGCTTIWTRCWPTCPRGAPPPPWMRSGRPHADATWPSWAAATARACGKLGATHHVVAMCGGVTLDLRQARFTAPEVLIHATAMWGGVDVIIDPTTRVSVEGGAFLGDFRQARDRAKPRVDTDSPLVRMRSSRRDGRRRGGAPSLPGETPRRWFGRR